MLRQITVASVLGGTAAARGLPPAPPVVPPNTQQVRAETDQSDQVLLRQSLQGTQVAAVIGNTVPLVFCREVGGVGGVMVSPPCVRAGFQVTADKTVSASYLCVLSDGQLSNVSLSDVWHGGRKLNTIADYSFGQGFGVIPSGLALNNYFENGEDAFNYPLETGAGGSMAGLTLVGVRAVYGPNDSGSWNQQVHCFVRNGYSVTRLVDGVTGSSNNFADLVQLLVSLSGKISTTLVDVDALTVAAKFTNANGLFYNGVLASSFGLKDFLARVSPLFLLMPSSKNGKFGLIPSLPITSSFAINTGVITPQVTYGLEDIIAGSYSQQFVPLADRKFFRVVMTWRQQPAGDAPIVRTTVVGYSGYAVDGPFESYDLSEFCTTESHAIKIGRFILAQRKYVTHTIQFALKPERRFHEPGDIIRLAINRISSAAENLVFTRLYMITSVTEQPSGEVSITAAHFPVDQTGRSLVAQEVVATALINPVTGEDQCPDPPPGDEPDPGEPPSNQQYIIAYGGTVTTDGDYKVHTFTSSGTLSVLSVPPGQSMSYLIVAGGGDGTRGSNAGGGGGGGGGVLAGTITPSVQSYAVAVGLGGQDSSCFGLTAIKGGDGEDPGGSGGGGEGGASTTSVGGAGTVGQGNAGGFGGARFFQSDSGGFQNSVTVSITVGGGGGGGGGKSSAGSNGASATPASTGTNGGNGGSGFSSSISGTSVVYGAGGGGGGSCKRITEQYRLNGISRTDREYFGSGSGGSGGSGAGNGGSVSGSGDQLTETNGGDAVANRGGGGGGAPSFAGNPGKGGSGVVIVRYRYQ